MGNNFKPRIAKAKQYFSQKLNWDSCYLVYFSDEDAFKFRRVLPPAFEGVIVSEYANGSWHDTSASQIILPLFGS
jgi:hypothetical protein